VGRSGLSDVLALRVRIGPGRVAVGKADVPGARVVSGLAAKAAKPRISLLPARALLEVARVSAFGASKHGEGSWRDPHWTREIWVDAVYRHWAALQDGETHDPESGLHHAAHLACGALYLLWHEMRQAGP
jgi:hypothetical protein